MKSVFHAPKRIAIIGSALGGGAAQVIDAISRGSGQIPIGVFDNHPKAINREILGVQVVGSSEDLLKAYENSVFDAAVIAIGNLPLRKAVYEQLIAASIPLCNVIDKDAVVSQSARIGVGNVLLCHSYLGPDVIIGDNCYVITGSKINHDSRLGSHCYLSTGVSIAGRVQVGSMGKFDTASGAAPDCLIPSGSYLMPGQIATTQSFPKQS